MKITKNTKNIFPGMRVFKTVLAVYVCFLISFIKKSMPFYSTIAAILCMQNDNNNSFQCGKSRMIGTLIGGFYGFLAVVLINFLSIPLFNYLHYFLLSIFLIPLIYTNVNLKSTSSTYISCVVFLSITVSHGSDLSPMNFALNRVIETLIGIVISLIINWAI